MKIVKLLTTVEKTIERNDFYLQNSNPTEKYSNAHRYVLAWKIPSSINQERERERETNRQTDKQKQMCQKLFLTLPACIVHIF